MMLTALGAGPSFDVYSNSNIFINQKAGCSSYLIIILFLLFSVLFVFRRRNRRGVIRQDLHLHVGATPGQSARRPGAGRQYSQQTAGTSYSHVQGGYQLFDAEMIYQ